MDGFPWYQKDVFGCVFSSFVVDNFIRYKVLYWFSVKMHFKANTSKLWHEYMEIYSSKKANNIMAKMFLLSFIFLSLKQCFIPKESFATFT